MATVATLVALLQATAAVAAPRTLTIDAPPLYVAAVTIAPGASFTFETESAAGVDPVAYLLAPDGLGGWIQVAYHDDVSWPSDPDVRLEWTNSTSFGSFLLVLRAYSPGAAGSTNTKINQVAHRTGVPVGGLMILASALSHQAGDEVRTAQLPGQSVAQTLFGLSNGYLITDVALSNGPGMSAWLTASSGQLLYLLGTLDFDDGSNWVQQRAGLVRLTSNDVASDADGDGLGDALEAELQTCSQATGCPNTAFGHGRDTDRDGVDDFEEVYGIAGTDPSALDDVALPRWGASPRKKDVFLEVDHVGKLDNFPAGTDPFVWMRNHPTDPIGSYASGITPEAWVDTIRQPYLAAPSTHVRNPNGTDGVEVHFDLGVQPLVAADEAKFGDWGGLSQRTIVENQRIDVDVRGPGSPPGDEVTVGTFVTLQVNNSSRSFNAIGMTASDVCYGLIFQLLQLILEEGEPVQFVQDGCSEAKPYFWYGTSDPTLAFETGVSAAPALPFDPAQVYLSRSGVGDQALHDNYLVAPSYRDVARRGRVRYAVVRSLAGGGKGGGLSLAAGLHHQSFAHELGHTLALSHWGHDQWGTRDVNCVPQYFSLMRYGSSDYFFASNESNWTLNPARTVESHTFGNNFAYAIYGAGPFWYPVPPTSSSGVDWNRDLILGNSSVGWRSMALDIRGGSCKAYSAGLEVLGGLSEAPTGAVDLQRINNRLYAFWVSGGQQLRYRFADLSLTSAKACTGTANPLLGNCLTWSTPHTIISDTSATPALVGVTAAFVANELFLASRSSAYNGRLRIWRCEVAGDGSLSIIDQTDAHEHLNGLYPGQYRSTFAPELVTRHVSTDTRRLGLLYLDNDGSGTTHAYRSYGWNGSDWLHLGPLLDTNNQPLTGRVAPAAKAWPGGELAGWIDADKRTLAVLPGPDDKVRVYALVPTLDRWLQLTTLNLSANGVEDFTSGRPFLEYRAVRDQNGQPTADFLGHFMIGWHLRDGSGRDRAFVRFSSPVSRLAPPSSGTASLLGVGRLYDWLQNAWATQIAGTSATLYSDPALDNVFGFAPLDTGNGGDTGLVFYPHADGSPDLPLTTYSDFKVMEDGVCEGLLAEPPAYAPVCGTLYHID